MFDGTDSAVKHGANMEAIIKSMKTFYSATSFYTICSGRVPASSLLQLRGPWPEKPSVDPQVIPQGHLGVSLGCPPEIECIKPDHTLSWILFNPTCTLNQLYMNE